MVDDNTWPPEKLICFTPLLLIHCQGGHYTPQQVTAMAELMYKGDIGKVTMVTDKRSTIKHDKLDGHEKFHKMLDASRSSATKEIEEILAPLEKSNKSAFILIEGAPGIGKSVLLHEISYRWAKKELLKKFELVLLICLRDPSLQQIVSVNDLLQLFCKGDKIATQIVNTCAQYLFANGGKTVTLLLDGYDEYPEHLRKTSLISKILKRQVLPLCGLVVSSRPHASEHLRQRATMTVNILGFTEIEREHYITQALPDQPHKIRELTQYLHKRPSLDSIFFIPFNMVILLYLYKLGIPLPRNSTDLYHYIVVSIICRQIYKFNNIITADLTNLNNLPDPYNRIIKQLSKLSLDALNNNELYFTFDKITAACPDIAAFPQAINGFGLLHAVKYFGLVGKTMILNFMHFTIQDYLAAHYVSHLSPNEILKVMKANFWSDVHFNMFSMYVSLTKGQKNFVKEFLSDGNKANTISYEILENQLKCVRLYYLFNEADDHATCNIIEKAEIFESKEIKLGFTTLKENDMKCISLFLTSSFNKEWKKLNLWSCSIHDKGLNILFRGLYHASNITINQLWLSNNILTSKSSSLISNLTVKCKVKELVINDNITIGEDQHLYSMLRNPSNVLEQLCMGNTKLSSRAGIDLFTALKNNNKLTELNIEDNAITDDACDVITAALKRNSCLVKLGMHHNPLSSEAIINIVQCLEVNNSLNLLGLPDCPQDIQDKIKSLQEIANKKRERCQLRLKIKFAFLVWMEGTKCMVVYVCMHKCM